MYRRIREWPHDFGNGCFIENAIIPEFEKIITSLIKKIRYFGIVDAEFKKDPRDNMFKLIEINPRCWMQNSLPARYGINFSYIAYMDTIGKKFEKQYLNNKNIKWLFMQDDFYSSFESVKKGELSFSEWINSFRGKKEYAIFSKDDPLPFFVSSAKTAFTIIPKICKK